jgi:hypothetical protein
MGAIVFLSLLGAIPACAIAAVLWARAAHPSSAEATATLIARAARWTAAALVLQAISLLATALAAILA